MIERACQLTLRIVAMDRKFAETGAQTDHDSRTYLPWSNSLSGHVSLPCAHALLLDISIIHQCGKCRANFPQDSATPRRTHRVRASSSVYYLTTAGEGGPAWREQDWATNRIIKCVKGEPIKGWFTV